MLLNLFQISLSLAETKNTIQTDTDFTITNTNANINRSTNSNANRNKNSDSKGILNLKNEYKHWPEEAVKYLNQLPNQELSLQFVVAKAVADSDVFQIHKAEYMRGYATYLSALAAEDFRLLGGVNYIDNRNEPVIPLFMATSTQGWNANIGFEQFLSTGTMLKGGVTHSYQRLRFLTNPELEFRESRMSLGLDQSLLSDFGGTSYKNLKKSAFKASKASEFMVLDRIENSILETISFYYNAWIKQQILKNLKESLERRQKLNSILKNQRQKGLIEASASLQIEGSVLNNQAEVETNRQELQSMWQQLVIQLKLPDSFLEISADEIPMTLDTPEERAAQSCDTLKFQEIQKLSSALNQAQNAVQSAEKKYQGLLPKLLPDLRFQATVTANGIDANVGETWKELTEFANPGLNLGLTLNFPLQNSQAKSQIVFAQIELSQAKTNLSRVESQLKVRWRLLCDELEQKVKNRDLFRKINSTNFKRVALDNRRFKLGRIEAFQWVQTEDDQSTSYLKLQQSEVDVRLTAWEIEKLTGKVALQIKDLMRLNHE